jgi:hypothetical protein
LLAERDEEIAYWKKRFEEMVPGEQTTEILKEMKNFKDDKMVANKRIQKLVSLSFIQLSLQLSLAA